MSKFYKFPKKKKMYKMCCYIVSSNLTIKNNLYLIDRNDEFLFNLLIK